MEEIWFETRGKVIYDPVRPGMRRRTEWWAIVSGETEITRYFRYWVNKTRNPLNIDGLSLCEPSWNCHLSLVRGEKPSPKFIHNWKKHHGEWVTYRYKFDVYQTGQNPLKPAPDHFWCVEVDCPIAFTIREELGLPFYQKFHMTIGRTY